MNRPFLRPAVWLLLFCCLLPFGTISSGARPDVLLETMQRELQRASTALAKSNPAAYFLSYTATDLDGFFIVGANGSLMASTSFQRRQADAIMRVGSPTLDNTHSHSRPSGILSGTLPLNDDADAVARVLWQLTDREYEQASAAFLKVKTSTAVQSEEEDKSPDFSQEPPQTHVDETPARVSADQKAWETRIRRLSAGFLKFPEVYSSAIVLQVSGTRS